LEAITEQTLIIGIDVAKKTHVARFFDHRGDELYEKIKFDNSREGFCSFVSDIEKAKTLRMKQNVIIGLEPTGVYGHALISYLQNEGYNVVYVLGMQVKRIKELEDNSPAKNDIKDAKVIASLVKSGYYYKIRANTEEITELKEATRFSYQVTKKLVRVKCQIKDCLTEYFPEFTTAFKSFEYSNNSANNKTALVTLHLFPMPDQIRALTAEGIVSAWRASGVIKGIGIKKAEQLKRLAEETIGLDVTESVRIKFRNLIAEHDFLKSQENEIWRRIKALLETNPDLGVLMGIPNITFKMAAYLLAEVGDFRDFGHPQQLVKLAGLNLRESSSGKNRGVSEITKRGRPMLRRVLYFIILEQLKHAAPGWYQLHKYYTTRKEKPLRKMQSVIALCCKFLRVVWGMFNTGTAFDPDMITRKKALSKMA
jgi:transposase